MKPWQDKIHEIVYEADTPGGRLFDITLLWAILISIAVVMLESVKSIKSVYGSELEILEWAFTILFSIEYVLRIISIQKPFKYILSFYGLVDLLSILPTFLSLFIVGSRSLIVIRSLRLLRVFRILKLVHFISEANTLVKALNASKARIIVFLFAVLSLTFILGTVMYLIEGGTTDSGFTSIPRSIYWAIVTLTTVGYGDIAPQTVLGQSIASLIMIIGYAVLAVPTGIVSAEIIKSEGKNISTQTCRSCAKEGHDIDATHCKYCGEIL